jgi:uncharacterized protein (TIGR00297 family)
LGETNSLQRGLKVKRLTQLEIVLGGLIISFALGVVAFRNQALSKSGTLAAILVGTATFVFGGVGWFGLLAVFFLSSLYFTRFKARQKEVVVKDFAKGGVRDFWQVLANGGVAALLAAAYFYYQHIIFFYAFLGVIGTVTADTWATEIGITGGRKPVMVTTRKPVPVGTSGAVSFDGTVSAFAGALAIALSAILFASGPAWLSPVGHPLSVIAAVAITVAASLVGVFSDSLMGATVQAMYYCTRCRKETERRLVHSCGEKTAPIRGLAWFDNDMVNLASSMAGGLAAAVAYLLIVRPV